VSPTHRQAREDKVGWFLQTTVPRAAPGHLGGLSALRFDANVHAGWHVEAGEGVHRLASGLRDVDQALVRPDFKLLPGLLVHVRATENRKTLDAGRKWDRPANDGTGPLSGLDDVGC
jgi:hypothetical protein